MNTSSQASQLSDSTTQQQQALEMAATAINEMAASLNRTHKTVELAHSAQQQFSEITSSIVNISDLNTQIATAAEEQQHVAEDINRNVVEIKNAADDVSDIAQSARQNGERLNQLSHLLTDLVGKFKV